MNNLISIITPVYNAENYISESIESVLNQSYPHWELLIINDGSTDQSREIIQSFNDKRIRFYEQQNGGVSSARNLGLSKMKGDYFCFLDADDTLSINSLELRLRKFMTDSRLDIVDGHVLAKDFRTGQITHTYRPKIKGEITADLCALTGHSFFCPSWMMKRTGNDRHRFNENLTHGEDLLYFIEVSIGKEYGYVTSTILHYRTGHQSAMSDLSGLEKGYRRISAELKKNHLISDSESIVFHQKSRSIMFKSYLGHWKPFAALRVLLTW